MATTAERVLSVETFKREFIAEVEEIQVLLVAIEQKSEPQAALGELGRNFRAILSAVSLLQQDNLSLLAFNACDLIDYVASDHIPYSTAITDILLRACDYLLKGFRGFELTADGRSWGLDPAVYEHGDFESFIDELWMARQGVLPVRPVDDDFAGGSGARAAQAFKPKKIGEILVDKGLISEGDLGGLIEAQQNARKVTLGDI